MQRLLPLVIGLLVAVSAVTGIRKCIGLQKRVSFHRAVSRNRYLAFSKGEVIALAYLFRILLALRLLIGCVCRVSRVLPRMSHHRRKQPKAPSQDNCCQPSHHSACCVSLGSGCRTRKYACRCQIKTHSEIPRRDRLTIFVPASKEASVLELLGRFPQTCSRGFGCFLRRVIHAGYNPLALFNRKETVNRRQRYRFHRSARPANFQRIHCD